MEEWNKIFKINKELDKIYYAKYLDKEPLFYEKNCIGLIVEIAELANETKCFKYWSIKKQDKEKVLEEYADTITMTLCLFTKFDLKIENIPEHYDTDNKILLFNELFIDSSNMLKDGNEMLIKRIFSNLIYLGELLCYNEEELINACYKKMNILKERLNSDY